MKEISERLICTLGGTGTTLKACENLGRNWVGIEQEENNCQIAKYRIEGIEGGLF
ncbi:hypothetical protein KAR91_22745 [Candidatus Pacearchaeota archaeon]|nr:hypothetical protein [Candidatus Pacearchaeota archaeon]